MNPITHLLAGWSAVGPLADDRRDRALIAWAGVAPDLDGLGLVVDLGNRLLGRPETFVYGEYHHLLFHGLFGSLVTAAAVTAIARHRLRVLAGSLLAFHLHLLCDLVGSRGPAADDVWPIHYLGPFSEALTVTWQGQWPLVSWQNVTLTLVLLALGFRQAIREGFSPVTLLGERADRAFVSTVRARWSRMRARRG